MVYRWKFGGLIKADADEAGRVCEELSKTVGLTPENLLDASRDDDAPLHGAFTWDDAVAGEAYRKIEARRIIQMLVIEPEETHTEPVRAFFKPVTAKAYEETQQLVRVREKADALLETALRELQAFQRKYSTLSQLAEVFKAIEEVSKCNVETEQESSTSTASAKASA